MKLEASSRWFCQDAAAESGYLGARQCFTFDYFWPETPIANMPPRSARRRQDSGSHRFRATVSIPSAFDFDAVFRLEFANNPVSDLERENFKNTAYFILHALSRHKYDGQAMTKVDKVGFLPLASGMLKANCGERYRRVLEIMCAEGLVEQESKSYAVGRSRRYRLSSAMDRAPQQFKELAGTVRERHIKYQVQKHTEKLKSLKSLEHLTTWLDGSRLTVETEKLHAFVELAFQKTLGLIADSTHPNEVKAELRGRAALRVNHQLESIRRVLEGDFSPSNTGRDERLHTLLTRLKRELRSFLLYDGQPLVSLDIRSSQPYFLIALLSKRFYTASEDVSLGWRSLVLGEGHNPITLLPSSTQSSNTNYYSTILPVGSKLSDRQVFAKAEFPRIAWEDGFYRDFARKIAQAEPTTEKVERTKKDSMWLFFEPRPRKFNTKAFKDFEMFYPVEAGIVRGIHSIQAGMLPVLLQRLEARILLHHVTKTISKRLPLAPLLTIHDSIHTTPAFTDLVECIMASELKKLVGAVPGIKKELKTADSEFASVTRITRKGAKTQTGIESFAQTIFNGALKSYQKAQKHNAERSCAHYQLGSPLLFEGPVYNGKRLFSPRYYSGFASDFPENPADVLSDERFPYSGDE